LKKYTEKEQIMLFQYMNECGSDKANGWHNYTNIYETIMKPQQSVTLLEIQESNPHHLHASKDIDGSLKAWRRYFHGSSYIYGCPAENIYFNPDVELDVLIDDSGLSFAQRIETLEKSWTHLKVHGYYIFEDILATEVFQARIDLLHLHQKYKFSKCNIYEIQNINNSHDNNLIILQKSDASTL